MINERNGEKEKALRERERERRMAERKFKEK